LKHLKNDLEGTCKFCGFVGCSEKCKRDREFKVKFEDCVKGVTFTGTADPELTKAIARCNFLPDFVRS